MALDLALVQLHNLALWLPSSPAVGGVFQSWNSDEPVPGIDQKSLLEWRLDWPGIPDSNTVRARKDPKTRMWRTAVSQSG